MQSILWSFMTYVILGMGISVSFLILSGFQFLERLGEKVCGIAMGCGGKARQHKFKLRLPLLFLIIAVSTVTSEHFALVSLKSRRGDLLATGNSSGIAELRARVLRHQRNWWISVGAALVWGIVWRFSGIVRRLRDEIQVLKAAPKL
eukprot:Gregarina_sp_Pseudo_9__718@NODE_1458_length_1584_cov_28_869256_g1355_i0_p2_GENE_NODE_1458_length_1584_cov_28_869256_g1355_i0NODE_1458_length_1584_cov_28_869256_g1355_i0_p2_ORF_typecomplete_len147_score24_33Bap31/PF05529_12/5_6e06_NODE_1458_length_1584_cov_28_869256_g1355_i010111451